MNDFDREENLGLIRVVICRSNPIDPDPRVEKTARALIKAGYDVILIAWDRTSELPIESHVGDIPLIRLPIRAEFGHGLQNLPNLLRWQWRLLWWLINNRDSYDVIHACDFDTVIPAILVKKLWGKCLVLAQAVLSTNLPGDYRSETFRPLSENASQEIIASLP